MILLLAVLALWPGLGSSQSLLYIEENERDVACASKICVNKCCPQGEYMQCDNQTFMCECHKTDVFIDFLAIQLYSDNVYGEKVDTKFNDAFVVLPSYYTNSSSAKFKEGSIPLSLLPNTRAYLGVDGNIQMESPNAYDRWVIYETDTYCVDLVDDVLLIYDQLILLKETPSTDHIIYVYAMFVSSFFLVLVLVVYAVLPDLRNLPGKILMAYVLSQLTAFMSLSMIQVLDILTPLSCEILTAIIYDSFLSSFCWLNVMSYDIFWTFRSYAKARHHRHGENFKFCMYAIYAWGVPLALTVMMMMMQRADFSDKPWIIKPLINERGCFLMEGQKFVYLYAPMLILIICNWVFFMLTVFNIWRVSRSTAMARSPASGNAAAHRAHKMRFVLYIKLSVIMGVNWLLEVISSFYPELNGWWVADMYNLLIGFSIFMIFVCRRKIYNDLKSKFSGVPIRRRSTTNSTMNSTIVSSTESGVTPDVSLQVSRNPHGTRRDKSYERNV